MSACEVDDGSVVDNLDVLLNEGRKYGCLYVDPPWRYRNQRTRGAASKHYSTMTLEEIEASTVHIATLSLNARTLQEVLHILDTRLADKMTLLASCFWRDDNTELAKEVVEEFRKRGQRFAAARNHAKEVAITLRDGGHLVIEGSANLRSNGKWIDQLVTQHGGDAHVAEESQG